MKLVLSLSGGLDSTVLLYYLQNRGDEVKCISFDYGQRHRRELDSAILICEKARVEHKIVDISCLDVFGQGSSQVGGLVDVPEGHYESENMKLTVVPNRNMILLSLATAWSISNKFEGVAYAAHSGDHAIYPDCREEFTFYLATSIQLCDWLPQRLERPFIGFTKGEIARWGKKLNVPIELTWTCYKGGNVHCGKCGSCTERKEALLPYGDPTQYLV